MPSWVPKQSTSRGAYSLSLLKYCKVGKVSMGETLRMVQNCESFMVKAEEPSCHFTTGFLNGFFSTVKNQHVKETKCIAMGNPHCEWEIRYPAKKETNPQNPIDEFQLDLLAIRNRESKLVAYPRIVV